MIFSFNVNKKNRRNNRELEKEYNESRFRLKNEIIDIECIPSFHWIFLYPGKNVKELSVFVTCAIFVTQIGSFIENGSFFFISVPDRKDETKITK